MVRGLAHRGGDGAAIHEEQHCTLGANRLALMDPERGHQPYRFESLPLVAVFNGEIYNHNELRNALEKKGHVFRNTCDGEVILPLYAEYGLDCAARLSGMFAVAIWNAAERALVLFRDFLGMKPLYFRLHDHGVAFASEARFLREAFPGQVRLRHEAFQETAVFGHPLPPGTFFEEIEEVPPGCGIVFRRDGKREFCFRKFPEFRDKFERSEEILGHLDAALRESVARHSAADRPVGAYLSSGIDSTLATFLHLRNPGTKKGAVYSLAFPGEEEDESERIAPEIKPFIESHEVVSFAAADLEHLRTAVRYCEQPFLSGIAAALIHLAGRVRSRGEKCVVSGEGADELFWGYRHFRLSAVREVWKRRPRLLQALGRVFLKMGSGIPGYEGRELLRILDCPSAEVEADFGFFSLRSRNWYRAGDTWRCMRNEQRDWRGLERIYAGYGEAVRRRCGEIPQNPLEAAAAADLLVRLPSWVLRLGDRCAMARGVEVRMPYLDDAVVDRALRVPDRWKISPLEEKICLRRVARTYLAEETAQRPKRPLLLPPAFLAVPGRPEWIEEYLSDEMTRKAGIFRPEAVRRLREVLRSENAERIGVRDTDAQQCAFFVLTAHLFFQEFSDRVAGW